MRVRRCWRPLCRIVPLVGLLVAGCGQADDTILIGPMPLNEESIAAIRSQDQIVNEEEGGSKKIIRPTRGKKTR